MATEPRMTDAIASDRGFTLDITWNNDETTTVDLTGLVHRSEHFGRFIDDPAAFKSVRITDWGYTLEWENGLDWPAPNVRRVADEQRTITGSDLKHWQKQARLSNAETADVLGVTVNTIKNWRGAPDKPLPSTAQIAVRALRDDELALAAHFRPRRAGRPKKVTAA